MVQWGWHSVALSLGSQPCRRWRTDLRPLPTLLQQSGLHDPLRISPHLCIPTCTKKVANTYPTVEVGKATTAYAAWKEQADQWLKNLKAIWGRLPQKRGDVTNRVPDAWSQTHGLSLDWSYNPLASRDLLATPNILLIANSYSDSRSLCLLIRVHNVEPMTHEL